MGFSRHTAPERSFRSLRLAAGCRRVRVSAVTAAWEWRWFRPRSFQGQKGASAFESTPSSAAQRRQADEAFGVDSDKFLGGGLFFSLSRPVISYRRDADQDDEAWVRDLVARQPDQVEGC